MFTRKEYLIFIVSLALILIGYILMGIDPIEKGFGPLTLWIAPPILLAGFGLPILGILGHQIIKRWTCIRVLTVKHMAGFGVMLISIVTYFATLEPTASLWDCSEFIAASYKLQVPHTPGTPLSLLIGRIFAMFAGSQVMYVAYALNAMSAIFSAMAAYLVYHLCFYFASRTFRSESAYTFVAAILSAVCGGLSLAFSDTFWFSAVEAETYGAACFFLLLLVCLILKGLEIEDALKPRWLVLICYVGGLSYCIHPMCVLSLTLLPFTWYVKDGFITIKNSLFTMAIGLIFVLSINRLIGIGTFELAFAFDFFVVNNLNLPFYSGAFILATMIIVGCAFLIQKYPRRSHYTWSFIFLVLGFMPYVMLFIRSNKNPPIDETNPQDLAMIKAYMSRESYGSSPLLYGPYFDAQIEDVKIKKTVYHKTDASYKFSGTIPSYRYEKDRSTILPRMYSNDTDHVDAYKSWLGLGANEKPTFADNLSFMFSYQLGHMYFRYLLFNFAGRESDHHGSDWLKPWDPLKVSSNPSFENKARNQYWMAPLVLGLVGLVFQAMQDLKGFIVVMIFFLITGVILALYLNSPPIEPRERDYIYVGSFIAFCIWVGMGITAMSRLFRSLRMKWFILIPGTIAIPAILLWQNYNDHNRSGRTFQIDNARNLLTSCAANSILFTGGDNDTFPLWYLQEIEGVRTDVRVMVLSYMNTDWYIDQLRRAYYDSRPFQLTLDREDYVQYGPNDVLYIQESIKEGIDVRQFLSLLKEDHSALRGQSSTGDLYTILPSRKLKLKVWDTMTQSNATGGLSVVGEEQKRIPDEIDIQVNGNYLQKNALAILDLIVSNGWARPVYFNFTSLNTAGMNLNSHVVQEGNVYRLVSRKHDGAEIPVDKALMHKHLIEQADYTNLSNPDIYFNYEDYYARMITPVRQSFNTLAIAYLNGGENEKALDVLQFAVDHVYLEHLHPSYVNLETAEILLSLGKHEPARKLCIALFNFYFDDLRMDVDGGDPVQRLDLFLAQQAAGMLRELGMNEYQDRLEGLGLGL